MNLIVSILLLACVSDPTIIANRMPTVWWDASATATSYTLYSRTDGHPTFTPVAVLPCWLDEDEMQWCMGQAVGGALSRYTDVEDDIVEWCVTASNSVGESLCSNSVAVCMPRIWQPGMAWE